jgi:serine/threonine protein kinase
MRGISKVAKRYGKWIDVRPLGHGGQGHTYLVKEEGAEDAEDFVLKRLGTDRLDRARAELRAIEELSHPNIVRVIDDDLDSDKPYIVMEHCSGGSLNDVNVREYSLIERLRMFSAICRGVGHAHSHTPIIIHRDLKPANIFLREDKKTPVVGDFGLCFFDEGERVTLIGDAAVGPRMYIAPELAHGFAEDVSPRADVYSLGKVLYWMLAGRVFDREMHRHQRFDLTKDQTKPDYFFIYELLDKMIVEDPAKRLANANEVTESVEEIIHRIEIRAHHIDLSTPQHCNYCGKGFYKPVVDDPPEQENLFPKNYPMTERFGLPQPEGYRGPSTWWPMWLILVCDYCGNVQMFRPEYTGNRNVWKKG